MGLARALDHFQRDANLRLARGLRDLFNRLAHAIAAEEIHLRIHARGIAPQDVVDQADRFDVLAPVNRRAEAQAGDGVGHRRLARRLLLMLEADDVLGAGEAGREM